MSGVVDAIFGGDKGPTEEEKAARRLQAVESQETRRREAKENRRRASTAKTVAGTQRQGSLFPSDFAPSVPSRLG